MIRAGTSVLAVLCVGAIAGCSGDTEEAAATPAPSASSPPTVAPTSAPAPAPTTVAPPSTTSPVPSTTAAPPETAPPTTLSPDAGIPGLDSEDAFCAAWSRFGGSWQVAIAASVAGDPDDAARLEVLAAPTVDGSYDAIFEAWPEELAGERDVVADAFFGAFERRSAAALEALEAAGADADDLAAIDALWVEALASRDPGNPVLEVEVPSALETLVDDAAAAFAAARVPLTADPSMVITAQTPLTDEYLGSACPDQGSIFGQDVVG